MTQSTLRRLFTWMSIALCMVAVAFILIFQYRDNKVLNPLKANGQFTHKLLGSAYDMYDFGVADINDDNFLDIFTTNHSTRQKILINTGNEKFVDQALEFGLSTNREFPGAEPFDEEVSLDAPGLYIYWYRREMVIRVHDMSNINVLGGQVQIPKQARVHTGDNCEAKSITNENKINVDFSCKNHGKLTLKTHRYLFKTPFKLSKQVPLDQVHIGFQKRHPNSHEFILYPGIDRHGMAWADYNGDGQTDVFIVRGGGVGKMKPDPVRHNDELLARSESTFTNQAATAGIVKEVCPGRHVTWVDFDGDDRLDLYVGCGRETPPRHLYPNQLHWQRTPGQFVNVAAERGLDIPEVGAFVWLDADNDRDMDLFATDNNTFWLYVNQSGHFTRQSVGRSDHKVRNLTIADYDDDGDVDVFAVTEKRSFLVVNTGGTYELTPPESVGLPGQAYAAQWVDYDNDGLTDLYVAPDGLYRQRPDRRFEATQLLKRQYAKGRVFSTWLDADNDGLRDVLIAIKELPSIWQRMQSRILRVVQKDFIARFEKWNIILYRNTGAKNHWVQFQLIGSERNRPAVGAVVEVTSPDGTQRQQVGQAEGSLRSQGHYRLYFGLGQHEQGISAKIVWPDGHVQDIPHLAIDQLLIMQRDGLKVSRSTDD